MAKMFNEGASGASYNGKTYEAVDGVVDVPEEAVEALKSHGFTLVTDKSFRTANGKSAGGERGQKTTPNDDDPKPGYESAEELIADIEAGEEIVMGHTTKKVAMEVANDYFKLELKANTTRDETIAALETAIQNRKAAAGDGDGVNTEA